jgi:anti-anti-sigma factor
MTDFEISPAPEGAGLKVSGELDLATAPRLTEALLSVPATGEVSLELSEISFLDSSGLSAILAFARSRNGGGPLVILNPSEPVARVLELTRIDQHEAIEIRRAEGRERRLLASPSTLDRDQGER